MQIVLSSAFPSAISVGVDLLIDQRKVDEAMFQARGRENPVDTFKQGTLFAAAKEAIDTRKR